MKTSAISQQVTKPVTLTLTLTHSSSLLIHPTNTYYHWVIPKPVEMTGLCAVVEVGGIEEKGRGSGGPVPSRAQCLWPPRLFLPKATFQFIHFLLNKKWLLQKMLMFTKPHQGMGSAVLNILEPDPDEECVTIVQPRGDKVMDELLSSRTGGGD